MPLLILAAFGTLARFVPARKKPTQYTVAFQRDARSASVQKATPEDASKDPQYRILLENAQVRAFALTLPPGAQSFVRHEHNYLTVTLEETEVIMWRDQESPIQHFRVPSGEVHFFFGGSAHGIRNDSNAEYRNVTVEFLDPQVTTYGYRYESGKYDYGPVTVSTPVNPEGHFVNSLDLEKAVARDVQLLPGESLPATKRASLVIAVTPLQLASGAGKKISLKTGEVLWRETGETVLTNTGPGRERFAIVEFRLPTEKY